jgi:hypothetical protein
MSAAASAARITAARNVIAARQARFKQIEALAGSKGEKLPSTPADDAAKQYRERMAARVQSRIPSNLRGIAAGRIADSVLKESVENVPLDGIAGEDRMGVDLAVGLAQQAGVSREELENMLRTIEDPADKETSDYLRSQILPRVRARDQLQKEQTSRALEP